LPCEFDIPTKQSDGFLAIMAKVVDAMPYSGE